MSSSPPPEQRRRRRWWPGTLRARLVIGIVALIAVVCAGIAVATSLLVGNYLQGQLDTQLQQSQARSLVPVRAPRHGTGEPSWVPAACRGTVDGTAGPDFLYRPGQSVGTLGALLTDGKVTQAGILGQDNCQILPVDGRTDLTGLPVDGQVHTIDVAGHGSYRAVASTTPDGSVLITGLPLAPAHAAEMRLATITALLGAIALAIGGLAVFVLVRRSLRPLERVATTARAVADLPLERGSVQIGPGVDAADMDPRSEAGQVGAALNQLLGHVSRALDARHQSELRIRQFVADASHELRTPLTAIRGYAELARRDPSSAPHGLQRVEAESARMSALVDDLLLLARLDAGRPLAATEVDLTPLVIDAVSDARVAGPDHRWRLELPDQPTTLTGDPARLHQVLTNLLTNARAHTPAGTTVTASLRAERHAVVLRVADDGPGIPVELQAEIFGRFVRGDSSRARGAGSTGLGLAIVSAVVAAHGGTVSVDSRPGNTVFTVRIPATPPEVERPFGTGSPAAVGAREPVGDSGA